MSPEDRNSQRGGGGGDIPDGLLLSVLSLLLGGTLLVWTATGLAGLFAHGAWPEGVTFGRTPIAVRRLLGSPQDIPAAWPDTPAAQLSGYGLFWGLFIGQLMILIVLAVFAMGTLARWKAVRAREKAVRAQKHSQPTSEPPAPTTTATTPPTGSPAPTLPAKSLPEPRNSTPPPAPAPFEPSPTELAELVSAPPPMVPPAPVAPPAPATPLPPPASPPSTATPSPLTPLSSLPPVVLGPAQTRRPAATQALLDAEGPALVVTSDPTLWSDTKDARAKLGPVLLYDPTHLCDTPARLHWSPTTGCEDKATAATRATALLAPIRPTAKIDQAVAETAETLLRSYLHAAATDGRTIRHLHRWAQGTGIQDAVRILRTNPKAAPGAAGELESALTSHPERRDMAQQLTGRALSALSTVNIRESCTPNRADSLSLDSFLHEGGTLYVIGTPIEDPKPNPSAMPLLTALASSVVERGRRVAERSSSGRLDPPLTLILDDVAAVAPLPQLPSLLTTGHAQGLPTLALLRSQEQARARWPHEQLPT
ncbi:type IV secretory system conjugative DNA transfer family protein [Streptomyces sp. NPDC002643]